MRRFVLSLALCYFVIVFFSPLSIAITSLGEERADLSVFRTFFSICACLILSVSSSFCCLGRAAACNCGTPWTFLLFFIALLLLFFLFFFFFFFCLFVFCLFFLNWLDKTELKFSVYLRIIIEHIPSVGVLLTVKYMVSFIPVISKTHNISNIRDA